MMRHTCLCAALLFALLLAGCGQNGPLYLPGDPSEMKPPPQENSNEQDEDEARDDTGNES